MGLIERVRNAVPVAERERLILSVAAREIDPYAAANVLFRQVELGH
jgi:hypothetical protein